jgi:outer membrane protein assembly factor BamB
MAVPIDWYYATVNGACHILPLPGTAVETASIGIGTAPAVKEGIRKVWVGTEGGDLITIDAAYATILDTVSFGGKVVYTGCHGPNVIVGMQDGRVFAVDVQTGVIRWSAPGPSGFGTSQVAWAVETMDVLLVNYFGSPTTAFDAYSGSILWQAPYNANTASADNGVFYLTSGVISGMLLEARRATDGSVIWNRPEPNFNYFGVTAVGDVVYVTTEDFKLYALDASNGVANWSSKTPLYPGTPLYAQELVGTPLHAQELVVVPIWNGAGPPLGSSPGLAAYDVATGSESWVIGPLPGASIGEQPIAPLMRYFTGFIALPIAGIAFFCFSTGQIFGQWNLGGYINGLAYLGGDVAAWPL